MEYRVKKITRRRNGNYFLYIEDYEVEKIEVEKNTLLDSNIRKNKIISKEELDEFFEVNNKALCLNNAFRILSYSPKTAKEVKVKLKEKNHSQEDIDYAIKYLEERNYFNDELIAQNILQSQLKGKRKSKRAIKNKLIAKGIDRKIIEDVTLGIDDSEEFDNAMYFARRKLKSLEREEDERKKIRKLTSALSYRQFDYEVINKVIRQLKDEIDDE